MKKTTKIIAFFILLFTILTTVFFYPNLPDLIPSHWNINGEIDGFINKQFYIFLPTTFMAILIATMIYLPKIDPKKENYKKFNKYYDLCLLSIITFFFILHILTLIVSLGFNIDVNKVIPIILGLLFIIIGYTTQKTELNYFFGVKTPWTLSSELSWKKSNKLFGELCIASGIITILSSLLLNQKITFILLVVSIMISSVISIVASYFYAKTTFKINQP